jgi:hypothetical protein
MSIDPTSPWPYLAVRRAHGVLGNIDEARRWMDLIQSRFMEPAIVGPALSSQLRTEGRLQESLDVLESMEAEFPSSWGRHERAATYLAMGRLEDARPFVDALEAPAEADMDFALRQAGFHAQYAEIDRAFQFLDRAIELGNDSLGFYEALESLAPLRADPRWPRLIEPMKARIETYKKEFLWPPA